MVVASNLFSTLVQIALPGPKDDLGPGVDFGLASQVLAPVASAFGIWVVGNVGRAKAGVLFVHLARDPHCNNGSGHLVCASVKTQDFCMTQNVAS